MGHSHHHNQSEGNIKVAFFLNLFFSIVELIGGLLTNSVAILSDALHDLGDNLTLGVSWYFSRVAKKEGDQKFSYGYKRFSVLGAFISSFVLIIGSIFIIFEALPRLLNPINPDTKGMMFLALGGLLINGIAAYRLSKGQTINEKVVFTHLLEDVLGWTATLIGAVVMHFTDLPIVDPILSLLISVFILFNVFKTLKESFRIILQGTPKGINLAKIHSTLISLPQVHDVHDCHSWTMDGDYNVLSVHLIVDQAYDLAHLERIKLDAKKKMAELGINHTTIEFETQDENCDPR